MNIHLMTCTVVAYSCLKNKCLLNDPYICIWWIHTVSEYIDRPLTTRSKIYGGCIIYKYNFAFGACFIIPFVIAFVESQWYIICVQWVCTSQCKIGSVTTQTRLEKYNWGSGTAAWSNNIRDSTDSCRASKEKWEFGFIIKLLYFWLSNKQNTTDRI